MTDLQTFTIMLSKSKEEFNKKNLEHSWKIEITNRKIEFYFKKDESFEFCSTTF